MKVSQYMTRRVITIGPETLFRRAFDFLQNHKIHHLPVVEGDKIVGIVAERDLLLAAANFGSADVPVAEIMKHPPICVSEDVPLKEAARLLVVNHIGCLPVMSKTNEMVGIITETDIFKIAAGMLHARRAVKAPAKAPKAKTTTAKTSAPKTSVKKETATTATASKPKAASKAAPKKAAKVT